MSEKRQKLIETAIGLFSRQGFHGTGIDLIAEQANVSKKTMYHHFRSKEELIVAALRHHDGLFRNQFMRSVERAAATPYDRLLAIFDVAHDWFSQHDFFGCIFINAIGEYSGRNPAIQKACKEYKRQMRAYVEELARALDVDEPEELASEITLLLEGSIVSSQVSCSPGSANTARRAAKTLLDEALRAHKPGSRSGEALPGS